jgi:hypothetical protein
MQVSGNCRFTLRLLRYDNHRMSREERLLVYGTASGQDNYLQALASALSLTAVSVDYRLASIPGKSTRRYRFCLVWSFA